MEDVLPFEGKRVKIAMNSPRWGKGSALARIIGATTHKIWVCDKTGHTKFIEYPYVLGITEV
jgi:hypothetical protein